MKTFLLSVFCLAFAVAPAIGEQDQDQPKSPKTKHVAPAPKVNAGPRTFTPPARVQRNVNVTPRFQPRVSPTTTSRIYTPNVQSRTRLRNTQTFTPPDQDAPRQPMVRSNTNLPNTEARTRMRNPNNPPVVTAQPPQSSTTVVQSDTNIRNRDRDWRNRTNNNRNLQNNNNRNWQNNTSGNFTFEQARRRHHRDRHDRSWWRSRYNRISLFGGGYYYWDNNYWYPAYGYDPYYSTYTYDEPIYGYNNLEPGQVIANVQTALQEQGYYDDEVDGLIGPNTRAALSNFQRDHGLPVTASIDGPTLQALGLN
jgi:hypothetical protein